MSTTILFAKYSIAGVVNGVVSYVVIFFCMLGGLSPASSNLLGYAAGLVTSFLQSRHWVFRSTGRVIDDWLRFMVVFVVAYAANFLALRTLLNFAVNAYLAQLLACVVYVCVSFVLNSRFVFRKRADDP